MKAVNRKSIFTDVQVTRPETNTFDLSHEKMFNCKFGELIPITCIETLPGDKFQMGHALMTRMAPMVAPVMGTVEVYMHYFFVPNRLVWANWPTFITGGDDGQEEPPFPYVSVVYANLNKADRLDYMCGIVKQGPGIFDIELSAIPLAMYNLIYNEYYRDQSLIEPLPFKLVDGDNTTNLAGSINEPPLIRAWEKDYFTSALPYPQRGPEVLLPLGDLAGLVFNPTAAPSTLRNPITGGLVSGDSELSKNEEFLEATATGNQLAMDITDHTFVDLGTATSASIVSVRTAFALQAFLELSARAGNRYIEQIETVWNITTSDARVQRPEYIGGSKGLVTISEVLQTAQTVETSPQGNMSGHGIAVSQGSNLSYFCEEHGYIFGIMSIRPKPVYMAGVPKHMLRRERTDFPIPQLANIGEQEIQNIELFIKGDESDMENFGYAPRYSEMKYLPSMVHGEFRDTLDFWTFNRKFDTQPALNSEFIEVSSDELNKVFAVSEAEQFYCHLVNRIHAERKLPYFGNPKLI